MERYIQKEYFLGNTFLGSMWWKYSSRSLKAERTALAEVIMSIWNRLERNGDWTGGWKINRMDSWKSKKGLAGSWVEAVGDLWEGGSTEAKYTRTGLYTRKCRIVTSKTDPFVRQTQITTLPSQPSGVFHICDIK